ncbi:MAG: phospholipase D-like domain-containing protein [Terriglobia bacterium]
MIRPASGAPGTSVNISLPAQAKLDFRHNVTIYFSPSILQVVLPPAGRRTGYSFFGFNIPFRAINRLNARLVIPNVGVNPLKQLTAGTYDVLAVSPTGYASLGRFEIMAPARGSIRRGPIPQAGIHPLPPPITAASGILGAIKPAFSLSLGTKKKRGMTLVELIAYILANRNEVRPLIDLEEATPVIYEDLDKAGLNIWIALWGIHDEFVLLNTPGNPITLCQFCRDALKKHPQLHIYLLLWEFAGNPTITQGQFTPSSYYYPPDKDRFHWKKDPNIFPHFPFATHHEKFMICDSPGGPGGPPPPPPPLTGSPSEGYTANPPTDGEVGGGEGEGLVPVTPSSCGTESGSNRGAVLYCHGFNLIDLYWDQRDHKPPDKLPTGTPKISWHDTGIRVRGPVIGGFEKEFKRRWNKAPDPPLSLPPYTKPPKLTLPKYFDDSPQGHVFAQAKIHPEHVYGGEIREWYVDAIRSADRYIYIENQYLEEVTSSPKHVSLVDELISKYLSEELQNPAAKVPAAQRKETFFVAIVLPQLTQPAPMMAPMLRNVNWIRINTAWRIRVSKTRWLERPYGGWKWVGYQLGPPGYRGLGLEVEDASGRLHHVRRIYDAEGGIRVYTMVNAGFNPIPITMMKGYVYVHSKLAISDDQFTIGSCNISTNSFWIDSEANVAVMSKNETESLITRLFSPLLGIGAGVPVARPVNAWFEDLEATARANLKRFPRGVPTGVPTGLLMPFKT